ncbi:PucR family transcriptional regulator ligand-binding domain-containing protein [Streptomyces sp. Je 1-79]|uniref:helix-turn-helix domain-containing protein n=1 Tax=Streptomyces sp. Je 1-79 TaxID=2943847 RepID=UPI0021A73ADB|nr:helix-turn-helix domain-containing protein [Streptomyces sp. Je 1-79]MCT4353971.1 PucR family transcriptional regulator ligand-binding domain-containing protein [Streptomyces sp. Je 1-79]
MHVDHLLQLDDLDLSLVWGDASLLGREISGVTATDLEDPTRFLQPGEIVLSGLVWWSPDDSPARTERFVSALRAGGAAALLAGEETHGTVPDELVAACRAHGIALIAVPAHTSFRAITEAVYLRQWGDLNRRPSHLYALPENVRGELGRLSERGVPAAELLDRAFAHLGSPPCYLLTSSGRTVARTTSAPPIPARRAAESLHGTPGTTLRIDADGTAFDAWHLHLPGAVEAPPRALHEIAEVIAQHRRHHDRRQATRRQADEELIGLIGAFGPEANDLGNVLRACGLPDAGPYAVVVATTEGDDERPGCRDALAEALSHLRPGSFAVGERPDGEAIAVVGVEGRDDIQARLGEVWPLIHACRPDAVVHCGVSAPVTETAGLAAAVTQARYARAAARVAAPRGSRVMAVDDLFDLETLLAGVPGDVKEVYSTRVLGPLLLDERPANAVLLETLEVFLAHDGSWARTAKALHLHVNTVHYRIERIETLTGRDLSRLDHKLDLRAALLCR